VLDNPQADAMAGSSRCLAQHQRGALAFTPYLLAEVRLVVNGTGPLPAAARSSRTGPKAIQGMAYRLILCFFLVNTLSGCLLMTGPGLFVASVSTVVNTDKTPTDHMASWATGQDCSSVEYSKGREYCVDIDQAATQADTALYGPSGNYLGMGPFCYRTLGGVNCYNHPDPLASEQSRLQ